MCLVGLFSFVVLRTELGDILDAKPLSYTSILRAGVIHSLIHSCGEGNAGTHVRGTTCRGSLFHHGFRGMKLGPQSCTARFKTTTTTTTSTTKLLLHLSIPKKGFFFSPGTEFLWVALAVLDPKPADGFKVQWGTVSNPLHHENPRKMDILSIPTPIPQEKRNKVAGNHGNSL